MPTPCQGFGLGPSTFYCHLPANADVFTLAWDKAQSFQCSAMAQELVDVLADAGLAQ